MSTRIKRSGLAVAVLSLLCALRAPLPAGDYANVFAGSGDATMSGLVSGLRAESADGPAPVPPAAQPAQPAGANNELLHFWEDLKADAFDDACQEVEAELEAGLDLGEAAGLEGKLKRYMKQYPDKKIAVIDEVSVRLEGGETYQDTLNVDGDAFSIGLSAYLEGKSVVVRKMNNVRFCKELLHVLDLRKAKTILPVDAKRIAEMGFNEIWKFPVVLRASVGASAGAAVQPWATVSFSMGTTREMKPSVTLYRMSANALRVRIRLDSITVKSGGVAVGTGFDAGLIGLPEAEGFFGEQLNKRVVKEFNRYLAFKLGFGRSRAFGKKILLEFIVDPADPSQTARLAEFLKGDLGIIRKLIEMGVRFNDYSGAEDNAAGAQALDGVENIAQQGLGLNSSFAGANHFNGSSHGFNASVPVLTQHEVSSGLRYDRYQALGGGDVVHVHNASKREEVSNLNLPFIGRMMKHNTEQNFHVVNYEDAAGAMSDAAVVYQRYEGYIKHDERNARGMLRGMNEILKYAGTRGEGLNESARIDAEALFPRLAAEEAAPTGVDGDGNPVADTKRYKSALMSFSLAFSRKAVAEIIAAPSLIVMKAVINVMDGLDREIIEKVRHLLRVDAEGRASYDWNAARKALSSYQQTDMAFNPLEVVDRFCLNVSRLAADLAGVRGAAGGKARSERLAALLGGKGTSRLGYEGMLQVLVQLVSVDNIYAGLTMTADKDIDGEADISASYSVFNTGLKGEYERQFAGAGAMRDRFTDPTVLSD